MLEMTFSQVHLIVEILKQTPVLNKNNNPDTVFTGIIQYDPSDDILENTHLPFPSLCIALVAITSLLLHKVLSVLPMVTNFQTNHIIMLHEHTTSF